jgi:RNA polymerase sigma-70 factor (ECF subfamily)
MDRLRPVQVSVRSGSRRDVGRTSVVTGLEPVEALYRAIGPKLWRSLFASTGDREVASDAVAEAFAQAIARGAEIRLLEAWIWTAAFRIAAGELAKRRRDASIIAPTDPAYELDPPADHLVNGLRALPTNQRIAIVMHDYADRPTGEIADALGVTVATVHVHLSRARRRMRRVLEENDG